MNLIELKAAINNQLVETTSKKHEHSTNKIYEISLFPDEALINVQISCKGPLYDFTNLLCQVSSPKTFSIVTADVKIHPSNNQICDAVSDVFLKLFSRGLGLVHSFDEIRINHVLLHIPSPTEEDFVPFCRKGSFSI